jgi:hypothetical protein
MYARITPFQMHSDRRADALRIADEKILPRLKGLQGFKHMYVLAEENSERALVITLWDSAANEQASRPGVGQGFEQLGDILIGQPQSSQIYEVAFEG